MADAEIVELPLPWRYTKRDLERMDDATFQAARPTPPPPRPGDDWTAYNEYRLNRQKWDAENRRRVALASPHPNWSHRTHCCAVHVEVDLGSERGAAWGYKAPHRARWERLHMPCGKPAVAWDGSDRRRVGNLWGACRDHIRQAIDDDPTRTWYWHTGAVIDDTFDLDAELLLLVLGGTHTANGSGR